MPAPTIPADPSKSLRVNFEPVEPLLPFSMFSSGGLLMDVESGVARTPGIVRQNRSRCAMFFTIFKVAARFGRFDPSSVIPVCARSDFAIELRLDDSTTPCSRGAGHV
jgi:hypothetical protein